MNAQLGTFKSPEVQNVPMVSSVFLCPKTFTDGVHLQKSYAPGSPERAALQAAIREMEQQMPFEVPLIINGKAVRCTSSILSKTKLIHQCLGQILQNSVPTSPTQPCKITLYLL